LHSFEKKLSKSTSLNIHLDIKTNIIRPIIDNEKQNCTFNSQYYVGIEPRWYINMHKNIARQKSANNVNGLYLSSNMGYNFSDNASQASLNFGIQQLNLIRNRQRFQAGFIDANFGLGVSIDAQKKVKPLFQYRAIYGFAVRARAKDNSLPAFNEYYKTENLWQPTTPTQLCEIYRCNDEENDLFKIDLLNLLNYLNNKGFSNELNLAYERKIAKSPISINNEVSIRYDNINIGKADTVNRLKGTTIILAAEPRFYFRLKKSIATGESSNNLSGEFVSINIGYKSLNWNQNIENENFKNEQKEQYQSLFVHLNLGHQLRITSRFFTEFKTGIGFSKYKFENDSTFGVAKLDMNGKVKLGLAF
jgi:hypothetical protein